MALLKRSAERCRERATACRRLAAPTRADDLRDHYLRLAMSHEALAEAVEQLDRTDDWFAGMLARVS